MDDAQAAWCAEVFIDAVSSIADGKPDDELVPIGMMLRGLFDELDFQEPFRSRVLPTVEALQDQWQTAGEVRRRTRESKADLAAGTWPNPPSDRS